MIYPGEMHGFGDSSSVHLYNYILIFLLLSYHTITNRGVTMKQSTLIAIVLGVVIVGVAALWALNNNVLAPGGGNTTPAAVPPTVKTASDVLEKFDLLKAKINASGMWFGGAAVQALMGDETAMVYIYKPVGSSDDAAYLLKALRPSMTCSRPRTRCSWG